ncbi:MAG: hypothetical protein ACFCD0_02225 [Gemmataceae bacterium]
MKTQDTGHDVQCPVCFRFLTPPTASQVTPPPLPSNGVTRSPIDSGSEKHRFGNLLTRDNRWDEVDLGELTIPDTFHNDNRYSLGEIPDIDHGGGALLLGADFFVPPPRELGRIFNANTTLETNLHPWPAWAYLVSMGAIALIGILIAWSIVYFAGVTSIAWQLCWYILLAAIGMGIGFFIAHFSHECTYVGEFGIARFVCSGSRENVTKEELLIFEDAVDLRTGTVMHYTNGVYQNTAFSFDWSDASGKKLYSINGTHGSKEGFPESTNLYHFGLSAQASWTVYLLKHVEEELNEDGTVFFALKGTKYLKVGEGFVLFCLDGYEEHRVFTDEIEDVTIGQGLIKFIPVGSKKGWFGGREGYQFKVSDLANAQLFYLLMEELVGWRIV